MSTYIQFMILLVYINNTKFRSGLFQLNYGSLNLDNNLVVLEEVVKKYYFNFIKFNFNDLHKNQSMQLTNSLN